MPKATVRIITPSQTVGPFYAYCLTPEKYNFLPLAGAVMAQPDTAGEHITIHGQVLDGDGAPVPDAMIELWQADGSGRYRAAGDNDTFTGFGRAECNEEGRFVFRTILPGRVASPDGRIHAPHIAIGVFGKGLNRRLYTRMYFPNRSENERDAVLLSLPPDLRQTMIAQTHSQEANAFRFTIRLQGEGETVFLEA